MLYNIFHIRKILWDETKNQKLIKERGVSFEELIHGQLIKVLQNPKKTHQQLIVLAYNDYIWIVPCVEKGETIFLKTAFPSRKYMKLWKKEQT